MAQQPPSLSRLGTPGILLVGVRRHVLYAEADVVPRGHLGSEAGTRRDPRRRRQAALTAALRSQPPMPSPPRPEALEELKSAVGEGGWLDASSDLSPYTIDFRRLYKGATPLVLMPREVAQVARILGICDRDEVAVVPHGGNTGYCGGATPDESGSEIVLSMRRLNRIRELDAPNYSMIIEAGCTLSEAQAAANAQGRLFPLSLGSQGTAQIGGNLSTNA